MKKWILGLLLSALVATAATEEQPAAQHGARLQAVELQRADVNGVSIAYRVLGEAGDPAVVMVMGLGGSHMLWGDGLPFELADAGYRVVLFDNRDVGGSQRFDAWGEPTLWWRFLKAEFGFEVDAPYDLADMAADTIGLMDRLEIEQAHVVGASMGGMIAQVIAARYPERLLSLVSIMSTPGFADDLPPSSPEAGGQLDDLASGESGEDLTARLHAMGLYPEAMPRQIMAILRSGDRRDEVRTIRAPTLVLHGADDELIPPRHGEFTAELIDGARYVEFDGMAHDLPAAVLPAIVSDMVAHMSGIEAR